MDVSNVAVLDMVKSREALRKVIKMRYGESGVDYEHLFFFVDMQLYGKDTGYYLGSLLWWLSFLPV